MTAVCAAARHFHTDGPLAWKNPLIKGFLYYQPSSPLPKPPPPPPTLPIFFLIHLKEFPLLLKAITVPQSLYRNPPTHTNTHSQGSLIPHVHLGCGPWCKCGRAGLFSAVECMSFLSSVAAKGWERVGGHMRLDACVAIRSRPNSTSRSKYTVIIHYELCCKLFYVNCILLKLCHSTRV